MKIVTKIGNLLDVTKGHIINGCNAQGVMGSGLALQVKNTYPQAYKDYRDRHEGPLKEGFAKGGLHLGEAYPVPITGQLFLWNAITQEFFGMAGRNCSYDAIETCFREIDRCAHLYSNIVSPEIHIPQIGAGLGGGSWEIIREIIEQTCTNQVTLWVLK